MARAEIGTSKYEAKKLKASGLQKLKFYCQICSKQCRDANGFKNHLQSKSHLGRISNLQSSGKSNSIVSNYSQQFQTDFLSLLRVSHGTKSINANRFYQEYIRQRDHIHMNVTRWKSLTSFVKHLGQNGLVKVIKTNDNDDDESVDSEGFNLEIRLIDSQEVEKLKTREEEKHVRVDNEMNDKLIQEQIKRGQEMEMKKRKDSPIEESAPSTIIPEGGRESTSRTLTPIRLNIKKKSVGRLKVAFDNDSE
ncbi:Domain of Kin17 curved DNA-binding family protein [Candida parapsilosis]|uniref:C2H2-type domain-containing protein n=2 Tax=Candida parapsilosis TaxID=5480 RepID=G8B9D7_CANPC|nr:uncharacterized protein CPAR2_302260 [Candida parapsilosis]KAF6044170.1 Domain of Kin17 curved DNA-binding family protein [Candida parapsilosis]KAF6047730.1 Domain of Kin17 curved DNA-binding family protein [Candida parapsilosis]KAF6050302.1 Domain of Kin17 curved DNA-binding family protein [Candida parapsilosis]KAF6061422.1 Domain of Kin17 curved DNA-binding family protein [Candida parapsilosis]KAI5905760.1 KIN17-like protein [Candida parapsilosis]